MKKLFAALTLIVFFIMASPALAEHMSPEGPRDDPWNNCTSCHGADLNGGITEPSCMTCQ